ncbi:MAG: hypothetical protein M0R03_01935 [Novosphingobium sp.]|nr:hypothetical protein [Novosphingobium sp.]
MVETMESLGLAAGVVNHRARMIAANALLEAMETMFVPGAFGRIGWRRSEIRPNHRERRRVGVFHSRSMRSQAVFPDHAFKNACHAAAASSLFP